MICHNQLSTPKPISPTLILLPNLSDFPLHPANKYSPDAPWHFSTSEHGFREQPRDIQLIHDILPLLLPTMPDLICFRWACQVSSRLRDSHSHMSKHPYQYLHNWKDADTQTFFEVASKMEKALYLGQRCQASHLKNSQVSEKVCNQIVSSIRDNI